MMVRVLTFLALLLSQGAITSGSAELGGVAVSSDRGQPIRRAVVRITAPELRGAREIPTDNAGRFHFTGLPAGRYTLTARKAGFVESTYGATRRRGLGTAITLADNQKELGITFPLMRGAVVAGKVTTPSGQPVDAFVEILERTIVAGKVTVTRAGSAATDATGAYRIADLAPGTYIVGVSNVQARSQAAAVTTPADLDWAARQSSNAASLVGSPPPVRLMALAGTFYPGVREASAATVITLESGSEQLSLNIPLQYVAVSRVSGTVVLPDGQPAQGGNLSLVPAEQLGGDGVSAVSTRANATIDARGRFEFSGIEAGRFVLTANSTGGGRAGGLPDLWARQDVAADGRDLDNLVVHMQPKVSVAGRVIAEEGSKPIDFSTVRVTLSLRPADGPGSPGLGGSGSSVRDGSFLYPAVTPWSYTIAASISPAGAGGGVAPGWAVASVTLGGLDVFDKVFEVRPGAPVSDVVITLTSKPASLSGTLTDGAGRPATEYFVVLVPTDRSYWAPGLTRTPRAARPASDGTFRFEMVTPGEYVIAASTGFDAREAADPAVLEPLIERGTKVAVGIGAAAVQNLRIK